MKTEIRESNGKKYRLAITDGDFPVDDCSCCIFSDEFHNDLCGSIDCYGGFFIEEVKEEPPTDEQIDRFLALYNEYRHVPSAALKLYPTAKDYIKAKWNEDKAKID